MESTLFKKQATSFACIREHVSGAIIEFFKLIFKPNCQSFFVVIKETSKD